MAQVDAKAPYLNSQNSSPHKQGQPLLKRFLFSAAKDLLQRLWFAKDPA